MSCLLKLRTPRDRMNYFFKTAEAEITDVINTVRTNQTNQDHKVNTISAHTSYIFAAIEAYLEAKEQK